MKFLSTKFDQECICDTVWEFCKIQKVARKDANFNGWNERNEVGIFTIMRLSKEFDFIMDGEMLVELQEIMWER